MVLTYDEPVTVPGSNVVALNEIVIEAAPPSTTVTIDAGSAVARSGTGLNILTVTLSDTDEAELNSITPVSPDITILSTFTDDGQTAGSGIADQTSGSTFTLDSTAPALNGAALLDDATVNVRFDADDVDTATIIAADFLVDGNVPTSVTFINDDANNADNDSVDLNFSADTFDTDETPFVDIVGAISDVTANEAAAGTLSATAVDEAPAVVVRAALIDSNDGGGQSVYRIYFSEFIDGTSQAAGDYSFSGASGGTAQTVSDPGGTLFFVDVVVNETESATESGVLITMSNSGGATFQDAAGNDVDNFTNQAVTAIPVVVEVIRTSTTNIDVIFSEDIDGLADTSIDQWTLSAGTVTAVSDPAGIDNFVSLTISGLTGTDETPNVAYVLANGALEDLETTNTPNAVPDDESGVALDDVAPVMISAIKLTDGLIEVTWSETVSGQDNDDANWTLDEGTVTAVSDPGGMDTMELTVTGVTSDNLPAITYTIPVTGNLFDIFDQGTEFVDALTQTLPGDPIFVSATTVSTTQIAITTSEIVSNNSADFNDFTLG
ncbi:MAG: hypothetical protein HRU07_04865 [Nitrosopumilus sp.]|nr:hypothetical protein [Nitrosopumilus sp.]NRA05484.1 hypothetical protein [Nitrosopumilus sp.]